MTGVINEHRTPPPVKQPEANSEAGMSNHCPPIQDIKTLSSNTCLSESTIERLVAEKRFPPPRRNKCGKRLWVWDEVYKYLAAPEDNDSDDAVGRKIYERTKQAFNGN